MRIDAAPKIDVYFIQSATHQLDEVNLPYRLAPAVANAIYAAVGRRVRTRLYQKQVSGWFEDPVSFIAKSRRLRESSWDPLLFLGRVV